MKAKWKLHYFISILMIPVLLLSCVRIAKTPHADDVKQLFLEHKEELYELAFDLMAIAFSYESESATIIIAEGSAIGSFVGKQGSLKYYSEGPLYPREEYENIHSTVADLFSSLNLSAIVFDQWGVQIVTSESSFGNCRLFYLPFAASLDINFKIKEEINLSQGWYAVVTYD